MEKIDPFVDSWRKGENKLAFKIIGNFHKENPLKTSLLPQVPLSPGSVLYLVNNPIKNEMEDRYYSEYKNNFISVYSTSNYIYEKNCFCLYSFKFNKYINLSFKELDLLSYNFEVIELNTFQVYKLKIRKALFKLFHFIELNFIY